MDSTLLSMSQQFSGLPMESLIGGPLNAATQANAAMALTQTRFMLDTCFSKDENGGEDAPYKPIMIQMELTRGIVPSTETTGTINTSQFTTTFNLPLLTIIPLNSLAVETVDVNFEMEVKSSFSDDQTDSSSKSLSAETSFEAKAGWGPFSVTVKGSVSYDSSESSTRNQHYEKSNSAKYSVSVHAGQLPLPKGVTTIIDAFSKSIEPIKLNPPAGNNPPSN